MAPRRRVVSDGRGVVVGGDSSSRKLMIASQDPSLGCAFVPSPSKISLGSGAMLRFGCVGGGNGSRKASFRSFDHEESGDEYLDDYFNQPEKKRRLSVDQVQFLERSFEAENKLEPERKIQLAKDLGLQPRQIAVWFQNRRARWKTRQMETDYETLHAKYECLKTNYETILEENEKLKAEVFHLKQNKLSRDMEKPTLQQSEFKECSRAMAKKSVPDVYNNSAESEAVCFTKNNIAKVGNASTDVITQSSILKVQESSRFPGFNVMDLLETRVDDDSRTEFLQPDYKFPRIEDAYCHPPVGSFNYGFPIDDHSSLEFWSC